MANTDDGGGLLRTFLIAIPFGILGGLGVTGLHWAASWIVGHAGVGFLAAAALSHFGVTFPPWTQTAGMALLLGAIVVEAVTKWIPTWQDRFGDGGSP